MASFGIGLALLLSGFTFYEITGLVTESAEGTSKILTQTVAKTLAQSTIIPQDFFAYTPYLGLAAMIIGVGWFWVLNPILHLTRPRSNIVY